MTSVVDRDVEDRDLEHGQAVLTFSGEEWGSIRICFKRFTIPGSSDLCGWRKKFCLFYRFLELDTSDLLFLQRSLLPSHQDIHCCPAIKTSLVPSDQNLGYYPAIKLFIVFQRPRRKKQKI